MSTAISWQEIILRLVFTLIAGAALGINRGEHGRPAGLRTTMLVCLAASLSMIQVNLLLGVVGKAPDSFVVLDLMRLPLGILSGMGFIGAGAILHKENFVLGVTTAATLWFATALGICLGGGQLALGTIALVLALIILSGFKWIESKWKEDHRADLTIVFETARLEEEEILHFFRGTRYRVGAWKADSFSSHGTSREITYEVHWRGKPIDTAPPPFLKDLARRTLRLDWKI